MRIGGIASTAAEKFKVESWVGFRFGSLVLVRFAAREGTSSGVLRRASAWALLDHSCPLRKWINLPIQHNLTLDELNMEYFTRKAYDAAQTPKGRKPWQQLEKDYAAHLRSINPELNDCWRQIATEDYSGEPLRVIERPAFDQVIVELMEHVFIFRGVQQARLADLAGGEVLWLMHEIHTPGDGMIELKVLLSDGELRITAEDVRVYHADASQGRIAA